jgi:hypothetical protein
MIIPDKDDEISNAQNPRKSRIVMEYELDRIYLAKVVRKSFVLDKRYWKIMFKYST